MTKKKTLKELKLEMITWDADKLKLEMNSLKRVSVPSLVLVAAVLLIPTLAYPIWTVRNPISIAIDICTLVAAAVFSWTFLRALVWYFRLKDRLVQVRTNKQS